jgi:peptidoglycan/LPS O-acetylase OafA/YrhL
MSVLTHWHMLPPLLQRHSQEDALSYVFYLAGGCVVACHLEQADAWVRRHARLVLALTAASALAAEGVYFLAHYGVTAVLGATSDPFQPSVIPFNAGAIACCYLAGVALVRPGRSRFTRAAVRSGSDNAYGVYLTHMLVITALAWLGWKHLDAVLPWPLLCLLTVGIVACCVPATALLARTPLAVPLTGRRRVPWRRPRTQQTPRRDLDGQGQRGAPGVPQRPLTEAA